MKIFQETFNVFICVSLFHTISSWVLLIAIRKNLPARTEIFGSTKTLVLGPKTMRLRHIFIQSSPEELAEESSLIKKTYTFAKWTGRLGIIALSATLIFMVLEMASKT